LQPRAVNTFRGLGIVFCVAAATAWTSCHHHDAEKGHTISRSLPQRQPDRPTGTPALMVHPGSNSPFAVSDVQTYFNTHQLPGGIVSSGPMQVTSLAFITDRELAGRLDGESTGLPDGTVVAFATLSGKFFAHVPKQSNASPEFDEAYAVFDSQTGNLHMMGSLK
jgi:hypothetical protein